MGRERRECGTDSTMDASAIVICTPTTPLLSASRWYTYGVMTRRFVLRVRRQAIRFKRRGIVWASVYAGVAANYLMTRLGMRSSLSAIDNSKTKSMTVPSKSYAEFRGTPTTRMYPRTIEEAFPNSLERAEWFYPPERTTTWKDVAVFVVGAVLWIGLAYYFAKD